VPAATNKALAPKEVTFANNAFHGQGNYSTYKADTFVILLSKAKHWLSEAKPPLHLFSAV